MAIFAKLRARYGNKWSSQFPSEDEYRLAVKEWGEVLHGIDAKKLSDALHAWNNAWPPSSYELREIARERALHRFCVALPKPKPNKEIGDKTFNEIKDLLNGK